MSSSHLSRSGHPDPSESNVATIWAVDELSDGKVRSTSYEPCQQSAEDHAGREPLLGDEVRVRSVEATFGLQPCYRAIALDIRCRHEFRPRHVLDLPGPLSGGSEDLWSPSRIVTRDQGFAEVAEFNAQAIEQSPGGRTDWAILIEFGRQVDGCSSFNFSDGVGVEHEHVDRPVRVVRPTPEEIDRYAVAAAAVEGGGS